ncbi:hypothetical protein, partial [Salmonella enterica]|uniref:hypothetical protein n=1 Tax=Salmonella enterica TaxID=28901 RepID=UPI0037541353
FITTVLKTERTVPWAQIEQFLFALYGLLIARQKEHANDQSRLCFPEPRFSFCSRPQAQPPPPARQRILFCITVISSL